MGMRTGVPSGATGSRMPRAVSDIGTAGREGGICRANSRRGMMDVSRASYPPVQSVRRALQILKVLNDVRIASVGDIHAATGLPKPTIVRMLDTLIADGYVARDNMCSGYHVTHLVRELGAGYDGIAEFIEVARPFAIDLTARIKWPVAFGTFDGDAMAIQFWTGTISPWVHASTLVGNRPNLMTSAMGRAYVAFCSEAQQEEIIAGYRANPRIAFGPEEEDSYRRLLRHVKARGYALRAPHTEPRRNTTIAMPVLDRDGAPLAAITVSYFTSAVPVKEVPATIIAPLRERVSKIQDVLGYLHDARSKPTGLHGEEYFRREPVGPSEPVR